MAIKIQSFPKAPGLIKQVDSFTEWMKAEESKVSTLIIWYKEKDYPVINNFYNWPDGGLNLTHPNHHRLNCWIDEVIWHVIIIIHSMQPQNSTCKNTDPNMNSKNPKPPCQCKAFSQTNLHRKPRYLRSMSLHSVCSLIASRIESDDTSPVSRTTFSSCFIVMRGRRTASRMGVGSVPWLCSAHSHTAWKMSISWAQKESLWMRSRTDICNIGHKQSH